MSLSRSARKTIRGLTYVTAAITLVLTGIAAPAHAATDPRPVSALPPIGATFELDVTSDGIELTLDGKTLVSEPMRGTVTIDVEANPADPTQQSVEAKPSNLRVSTKAAQRMSVTVQQVNAVVDEQSVLRQVKLNPLTFEHVMVLDLRITLTMTSRGAAEPVLLTTTRPARLTSSMESFPPNNAQYTLAEPVELVDPDDPAGPSAQLSGFDVIVNQSA